MGRPALHVLSRRPRRVDVLDDVPPMTLFWDALELFVNLGGAVFVMALILLAVAFAPLDRPLGPGPNKKASP